jgi:hypothetical protein
MPWLCQWNAGGREQSLSSAYNFGCILVALESSSLDTFYCFTKCPHHLGFVDMFKPVDMHHSDASRLESI